MFTSPGQIIDVSLFFYGSAQIRFSKTMPARDFMPLNSLTAFGAHERQLLTSLIAAW